MTRYQPLRYTGATVRFTNTGHPVVGTRVRDALGYPPDEHVVSALLREDWSWFAEHDVPVTHPAIWRHVASLTRRVSALESAERARGS